MVKEISFKQVVAALLDEATPFPAYNLHRFSDLPPADLKALLKAWPQVSPRRKQTLLEDLEDLAEADTLMCFDDLARALLTDPDGPVRTQAIHLLWENEDEKLIPTFIEILNEDEVTEVRAAAATALGRFVYLGEIEEIPAKALLDVEENLLAATTSAKAVLVRRRALEALGYSSRPEVPPLIEAAYRQKKTDWLASALYAMGRSCDPRWKKQVLSQLHAADEEVRTEAIRAAGELNIDTARSIMLDLLEDEEDGEIRGEIAWALSKIGGEGVRTRLEELLDAEPDDDEAEILEEALENLSFTEDMARFEMFDFDPDEDEDKKDDEADEDDEDR